MAEVGGRAPDLLTMPSVEPEELARLALPAAPTSPRRARALVAEILHGRVADELLDTVLVVTSELATNAVLHGGTGFELVVSIPEDGGLRVEVHDGNPRLPRRKRYSDSAATGRGLILVESLATVAGAEQNARGKVVWAVLAGRPPAPPVVSVSSDDAVVPLVAGLPAVGDAGELQVVAVDDEPEVRGDALLTDRRVPAPV
jgi:anti-sigma regulatory factor (Ser/Thr protein kinase)